MVQKEKDSKDKQKRLKDKKDVLKSPKNKIHYCICDFDHLDDVDPDAKLYDQREQYEKEYKENLYNALPVVEEIAEISPICSTIVAKAMGMMVTMAVII